MKGIKLRAFIVFGIINLLMIFTATAQTVLVGADQILKPPYLQMLYGKRIAVLANPASVDAHGRNIIGILFNQPKIHLVALFSAEHGLRGNQDVENIKNSQDKITGLPIYSLYGKNLAPTPEALDKLDIIIIDLQDVGLRYYTFSTTMAKIMQAAKKAHKQVMILDRVNPLGGNIVSGPVLENKLVGDFIGYYPIPTRYGLTLGELARYYNHFFHIDCNLTVIPLKNWQREQLFYQTGLVWHAPSPALPTFQQAFLYSVFAPLETLNMAVGRSLDNKDAFRIYGAPWISAAQAAQLVARIKQLKLPGLSFSTVAWVPNRDIYKNKLCHGFKVTITDYHQVLDSYSLISVLKVMYALFGDQLGLGIGKNKIMLGTEWMVSGIKNNQSTAELIQKSKDSARQFMRNRKGILLYH